MDIIHNAIIVIHVLVMLCLLYMSVCLYDDTMTVIAMNLAASAIIWPAAYIIPLHVEGVVVVALLGMCMWFKANIKLAVFVLQMLIWVLVCNMLMLAVG